ncbi:synaptonemal complex protein 1-like [Mytilus edulis]|uniref:synaptonemal complex protein 1-like n=1 Tax=Mytilus edulis TaxID=6550 RepID=UPI0039EDF3F3
MSLEETSKLLTESQKIFNESDDVSINTPVMLNMVLRIVSSIDGRLKSIETSVESVKDLRKDLLLMSSHVRELETSVTDIVKSQKQLETSCQVLSDLFDDVKEKSNKRDEVLSQHAAQLIKHSDEVRKVNNDSEKMLRKIQNLEKQLGNTKSNTQQHDTSKIQTLQNTVLDLQCRSMKNNLIFKNLEEQHTEDVEQNLRTFIYEQLGIEHDIEFGNVHRFGKRSRNNPRPIVARFLYHNDLKMVLDNARWLKKTPYSIHQQFPSEIEDRRRKLYPIQKEAKYSGKHTVLVRDKLFIDDK